MAPPLTKVITLYPKRGEELGSPVEFGSGTGIGPGGGTIPLPVTPNVALGTNASGEITPQADISTTELGYLDGATSNIQDQIDAITAYDPILRNQPCNATVYVGAAVRYDTTEFVNAMADSFTNSRVMGLVIVKPTATTCDILLFGKSGDIFAGLDVTKDYFLSPTVAGGITDVVPTSSGHVIQMMGRATSATQLIVRMALSMQRS